MAATAHPRGVFNLNERNTPMSDKPISPLRQRMIQDMSVRHFDEDAPRLHPSVRTFAASFAAPQRRNTRGLRRYQLHRRRPVAAAGRQRRRVSASFFFVVILDGPEMARRLTVIREPRRSRPFEP